MVDMHKKMQKCQNDASKTTLANMAHYSDGKHALSSKLDMVDPFTKRSHATKSIF